MPKNLLIVESPAKAKTIEKYLGKDFKVVSSYGHIRDLPSGGLAVDVEKGFSPNYEVPKDKKELVKQLQKLAKEAEEIWLATDEDREGEAISWHLCEVLDLDPKETNRIVFHEITKSAIEKAIREPRKLDLNLVQAQQARRILDRLVGFEVSPILWRKVSLKNSLSAGRVQSVAVRLLVEREREIQQFKAENSFKVIALFTVIGKDGKKATMRAELPKNFTTIEEAEAFLKDCQPADFSISDIEVKPAKKSPAAPFTTSTLQQEASRKLGFSVSRTMVIAQRLYEEGKITYMRTDSVNLSDTALNEAANTITDQYGDKYVKVRKYKSKSQGAQEAHEAIRPTEVANRTVGGNTDEKRLYDLIWKRTIASQMADAELERTTARISISTRKEELVAKGEVVKFDGFLKVYFESTDDDQEEEQAGMLPPIEKGQDLDLQEISATERFTRHAPRYTEASLVKKLEELGIGRPSTYAPTISTVQKRGYVTKEDRAGEERSYRVLVATPQALEKATKTEMAGAEKNKLFPTDVGMIVTDFLMEHFPTIMDYNFTAQIEKQFDEIAIGGSEWDQMIGDFYKPFHAVVEKTLETAERVTGERALGTDPKTGKPIIARMGRYGPMVQLGDREDEKKKFAKLRDQQSIETITLEEALELFKLPRTLGEYKGSEVQANVGRYGPYIMHEKKFYSLKDIDPLDVTLEQAIQTIEEQKDAAAKKTIKEYEDGEIQILNGPYGAYIKANKRNYKIPKGQKAEDLSLEECKEIIENAPPPKKRFSKRK